MDQLTLVHFINLSNRRGGGSGKSLSLISVADFQSEGNGSEIIFDKNKIEIN